VRNATESPLQVVEAQPVTAEDLAPRAFRQARTVLADGPSWSPPRAGERTRHDGWAGVSLSPDPVSRGGFQFDDPRLALFSAKAQDV
jgi:hypothetical protein